MKKHTKGAKNGNEIRRGAKKDKQKARNEKRREGGNSDEPKEELIKDQTAEGSAEMRFRIREARASRHTIQS